MRDDNPMFEVVEPPHCGDCGHFHWNACVLRRSDNCGSYLCCQPDGPVSDPSAGDTFDNDN